MQHKFKDVTLINRVENKTNKPNNTHILYTNLCHYFDNITHVNRE